MKELIYIVEDDNNIRELVSVALAAHSYTIKTFACAEDALAEAKHSVPDLIILDIMLPGIDGLTALKSLGTKRIPVTFWCCCLRQNQLKLTR